MYFPYVLIHTSAGNSITFNRAKKQHFYFYLPFGFGLGAGRQVFITIFTPFSYIYIQILMEYIRVVKTFLIPLKGKKNFIKTPIILYTQKNRK